MRGMCTPPPATPAHACFHRLRQGGEPGSARGTEDGNLLDGHPEGSWEYEATELHDARELAGCCAGLSVLLRGEGQGGAGTEGHASACLGAPGRGRGRGLAGHASSREERGGRDSSLRVSACRPAPPPPPAT